MVIIPCFLALPQNCLINNIVARKKNLLQLHQRYQLLPSNPVLAGNVLLSCNLLYTTVTPFVTELSGGSLGVGKLFARKPHAPLICCQQ